MKCLLLLFVVVFANCYNSTGMVFPLHRVDLPVKSIRMLKEILEEVPLLGNFQKIGYNIFLIIAVVIITLQFILALLLRNSLLLLILEVVSCQFHVQGIFILEIVFPYF